MRRMDRRALNALRKRRADKHMIAFLIFLGVVAIAAGVSSIVLWDQFNINTKFVGLLIIVGPIMILVGLSFLVCSMELVMRLTKQIRRVMDPSLLKTSNYHEVKHWIEPGIKEEHCILTAYNSITIIIFRAYKLWLGPI